MAFMTRWTSLAVWLLCACGASALAGEALGVPMAGVDREIGLRTPASPDSIVLTGDLRTDLFGFRSLELQDAAATHAMKDLPGRKLPFLAVGLSLVLPGAGEFYAESYWKSAGFLCVEAAMWGLAYYWDKRGDRQTDGFQDFANAHWSVERYAQYALKLAPAGKTYAGLFNANGGPSPWERVNWDVLHQLESDIAGYYSHSLAPHGDQQYYEMIGKYPQFNMGWDDASPSLLLDYYSQKANLSPQNLWYAGERGKANTYYEHATTFVTVAILNHLLSAVDAALTAGSYNRNIQASVGFQTIPAGAYYTRVPVLKVVVGI